jgi:hypothetical protein
MKFFLVTFLVAILVALAMAAADQQPIIVSFPEGTPYSELDELKEAIAKVVSWSLSHRPRRIFYLDD